MKNGAARPAEIASIDDPAALTRIAGEWQDVWWRHFGHGRHLACLVARDREGKLVGGVPFAVGKLRAGPMAVRLARLRRLVASRQSGAAKIRARVLIGRADLVNMLYYRPWFIRLALTLRRVTESALPPLAQTYIRTRI